MPGGAALPALSVSGLVIRVGGTPVVHGLDLQIAAGARVALLGASGSGKSLSAAAVAGCLPVGATAQGSVQLGGTEVLTVPAARRPAHARAGMVFQDSATALNPMVRVERQLREPLVRQGSSRSDAQAEIRELLAAVGLDDPDRILRSHPGALSGGQRQRVCLALALACRVPLLVADEPTTALDVITQAAVIEVIRARTGGPSGPALLFITHDLAVAAQLCDEIAVLDEGLVVEHGTTRQIVHAPTHPVTARLVAAAHAAAADLDAALHRDGTAVTSTAAARPELARALAG